MFSKKRIEYFTALFILLECNTVYAVALPTNGILVIVAIMGLLVLSMLELKKKAYINAQLGVFFLFYYINAGVAFLHADNKLGFICRFLLCFPCLIFYLSLKSAEDRYKLLFKIVNIMFVEAIISIVFYSLGTWMNFIEPSGAIMINWGEYHSVTSYYGIYFDSQPFRNSGFFAEAPMHSYCLSIALLVELFLKPRHDKWRVLILSVAILTTISTTGFLVLVSVAGFCILKKWYNVSSRVKILTFLFVAAMGLELYQIACGVVKEKQETRSYEIRNYYIEKEIDAWLSHPILGTGFGKNVKGSSNSLFVVLADGGVHFFILYFGALIYFPMAVWIRMKRLDYLIFYLIYVGMFCITVICYNVLTLMILALSLSPLIQRKHLCNYINAK